MAPLAPTAATSTYWEKSEEIICGSHACARMASNLMFPADQGGLRRRHSAAASTSNDCNAHCMPNGHCMSAGTGKTLLARAVANRTDACFIRVIGSELVQKYVGEGARMVRELFQMARSKRACVVFFDEVDAIGGARSDDSGGGCPLFKRGGGGGLRGRMCVCLCVVHTVYTCGRFTREGGCCRWSPHVSRKCKICRGLRTSSPSLACSLSPLSQCTHSLLG